MEKEENVKEPQSIKVVDITKVMELFKNSDVKKI